MEAQVGVMELDGSDEKRAQRTGHPLQSLLSFFAGCAAQPAPLPLDLLGTGVFLGW